MEYHCFVTNMGVKPEVLKYVIPGEEGIARATWTNSPSYVRTLVDAYVLLQTGSKQNGRGTLTLDARPALYQGGLLNKVLLWNRIQRKMKTL